MLEKNRQSRHLARCFKSYSFTLRTSPIHGTRCTTSLKPFPLSILRNSIRPRPYTNKLAANQRHNYHNTQVEDTTLPKGHRLSSPPTKGPTAVHTRQAPAHQTRRKTMAKQDKGKPPLQGNDYLRSPRPGQRPSGFSLRYQTTDPALTTTDSENGGSSRTRNHASRQRSIAPSEGQRRGPLNNPPPNIFDTGMEYVPELSNQPPTLKLHDQWNLEMCLIGQGEDEKNCTMLRVRDHTICQLSQQLGEKIKHSRADKEAGSRTSKPTRISVHAKNPKVLEAILSVVHGINTSWRINCFEDFVSLAATCWEFGCRTDKLTTLLVGRPTWKPNDPDEGDHAPIEQWIFAALVFDIPEIFEQATHEMVMDLEGTLEGPEHVALLPMELRGIIKQKAHEISEEIIGFVSSYISEYTEHPDPTSAGAAARAFFTTAMQNCLKSVGYSLFKGAVLEGKPQGVVHLLKALENDLPRIPPGPITVNTDLCTLDQTPGSPTAASHHPGPSNSSSLPDLPSAIPPRRARAALVIANAAVDLWDKRTVFADKIHHLVASDPTKKEGSKDTEEKYVQLVETSQEKLREEKYIQLVEGFQEKLKDAKPKWNFAGFDLKQFQTFPENDVVEEGEMHQHE
ncbi:unnamed protein product [Tuber melanosporum]|uniref:(Perigord truffle) hypothetical protein n=1 Tax=Tuber melanosporum (strain Mel28) TaxID=656061 RepID=D5G9Q4_TUBMM|nr:uncharacterized protein GSTUM_00005026001 [Tuber melanosporum]CAZ81247.1 unnamed protein product [Tuber melanosporum]